MTLHNNVLASLIPLILPGLVLWWCPMGVGAAEAFKSQGKARDLVS